MKHMLKKNIKKLSIAILITAAQPAWANFTSVETYTLSNGAPLEFVESKDLPRQTVVATFPGGCGSIPKEKQGVTEIISDLFEQGPQGMSRQDFQRQLFLLNGKITLISTARGILLSVSAPEATLAATLELGIKTLKNLKNSTDEFNKAKQTGLTNRTYTNDSMRSVVFYAAPRIAFDYHPDTLDCQGSIPTISKLEKSDVDQWSQSLFNIDQAAYSSTGPIKQANLVKIIESSLAQTGNLEKRYKPITTFPAAPVVSTLPQTATHPKAIIIDKHQAADNQILYIFDHSLTPDTKEFVTARTVSYLLGGGLNGRLMEELREKRGLTYGASYRFEQKLPYSLIWTFGTPAKTKDLLTETPKVLSKFLKEDITKTQLQEAKEYLLSQFKSETELPGHCLKKNIINRLYHRPPDAWKKLPEFLESLKVTDLRNFVINTLPTKPRFLFLMGDSKALSAILVDLGWQPEEIEVLQVDQIL